VHRFASWIGFKCRRETVPRRRESCFHKYFLARISNYEHNNFVKTFTRDALIQLRCSSSPAKKNRCFLKKNPRSSGVRFVRSHFGQQCSESPPTGELVPSPLSWPSLALWSPPPAPRQQGLIETERQPWEQPEEAAAGDGEACHPCHGHAGPP